MSAWEVAAYIMVGWIGIDVAFVLAWWRYRAKTRGED